MARLTVVAGLTALDAARVAEAAPAVARHLDGREVTRRIHVPDRLVNLVTNSRESD